jgi:hypothetical protein
MKALDLTGRQFGKWIVLSLADTLGNDRRWFCKCECGVIKPVQVGNLMNGNSTQCRSCAARRSGKGIASFRIILGTYKTNAENRGLVWNLTDDQFYKLTQGCCAYCGDPPSNCFQKANCEGAFVYNGVDRVDNTLGYDEDNTVSCCKVCNWMKSDQSVEEFLHRISKIMKRSVR